jgi:hypothetical protein
MVWRKKSGGSPAGPSPSSEDEGEKVPRGHVPMVTGCGERVLMPVRLLAAASIAELLDMAAESFGYGQPGVLSGGSLTAPYREPARRPKSRPDENICTSV